MEALSRGLARHRFTVTVLAALALLDLLTTTFGLTRASGLVHEQNALGLAAWSFGGVFGLLAYKGLFFLPVVATLFLDGREPDDRDLHRVVGAALLVGALVSTWIVAANLAIIVDLPARWLP